MKDVRDDAGGFASALAVIGGEWKAQILAELHVAPRRFGALRRRLPGIGEQMLLQRLREMEADGLVHREVLPALPPRVIYSLTDIAASLNAAVLAMSEWGRRYQAWSRSRQPTVAAAADALPEEGAGPSEREEGPAP